MRKLASLIIIALAYTATYAQVPGYMGLKCSLQYQGGISPQWNDLGNSYIPYYSHNVQLDYVLTRKHSIGIQYSRLDYGADFAGRKLYNYTTYDPITSTTSSIAMGHRHFASNNVSVYVKFFRERKGFIAPLGRYFVVGLSYLNTKDIFLVTNDATAPVVPYNTIVKSHDIGVLLGVGRNIIIANRMVLSVEGDINVPLSSGIRAAVNGYSVITDSTRPGSNPYKYNNAVDVMLINLMTIKIGIGALLF